MPGNPDHPRRLTIKKYSNRRFYDATRSRHVTLAELHDLVCDGYELTIIDSDSGDDITNQVLTQIILEQEPPKLGIFPTNILHQVIRTQRELLGGVVEQFFAQVAQAHRVSQERWVEFLQKTLGFVPPMPPMPSTPLDWTRSWMQAWGGAAPQQPDVDAAPAPPSGPGTIGASSGIAAPGPPPGPPPTTGAAEPRDRQVEALRAALADLSRRVEQLNPQRRKRKRKSR
jgi:polyhydroxyalkanoate synthesis repressor PhaR